MEMKQLQLHSMTMICQKQWFTKQLKNNDLLLLVPSLPARLFYTPEVCHVSYHPQSDCLTFNISL